MRHSPCKRPAAAPWLSVRRAVGLASPPRRGWSVVAGWEFRVLGPVEVAGVDGVVTLGGPQRRLILTILLASGPSGCATDALLEALWDEVPPAAITVLHAQISRLRKQLEPDRPPRAPARVLRSTEAGYVLDTHEHVVDADLFARHVEAGGAALDADDPATARSELTAALTLWRGPAYGDLAEHEAVRATAAELEELRITAKERLAEAKLRLGESTALVPDLEAMARDHPFRERIWGQLMLALYRGGRQADALDAFHRCRRRLVDQLGIEPGPALQELNEAILLQKSDLERPPRSVRPAGLPPRMVPVPAARTSFIGRAGEVTETTEALASHRLVTITGPAGVGKTRLAIEVATTITDAFHHGVAFCDLVGVPSEDQVAAAMADAVGVEELATASDDPLLRHLVGRELLLVVDNADQTVDRVADLANHLLAGCPRLRVLATSREPLRTAGERLVVVAPLAATDAAAPATQLFLERAALSTPRPHLDPDAVVDVCRRIDGLPLAIELAASRLRSIPLAHLLAGLDDRLTAIATAAPPRGSTAHSTLREVLDWSIDLLPGQQRALLRRLAVFTGGFTADATAVVCGIDEDPVEALAWLVDRSLVQLETRDGDGRYRLLETIRADGLARLAEQDELDDFRTRHLRWCLSLAPNGPGHGEDPTELADLGAEIDNVVGALAWALDRPDVVGGIELATTASPLWVHVGRLGEARGWLERAVAAGDSSSPQHRAAARWLGWILMREGDYRAARDVLADAVALSHAVDDAEAATDADLLLSTAAIEAGDLAASETLQRIQRERAGADLDPHRRTRLSYALGLRALVGGEPATASELLQLAAREARAAKMWYTLIRALTSLSQSYGMRLRFEAAERALADASTVARRHRLLGLLPSISSVGAVHASRQGDWKLARTRVEESLAAARTVGDRRVERIALMNLGAADLRDQQPMDAIGHCEEALDLAERAGDERDILFASITLAEAVVAGTHDTERALALLADTIRRGLAAGVRVATILSVETAAYALADRGTPDDLDRAGWLLGAAAAERIAIEYPEDTGPDSPIGWALQRVRQGLSDDAADQADRRGRDDGLDAAASQLLADLSTLSRR